MAQSASRPCAHCGLLFEAEADDFPLLEPFIALHERYCAGGDRRAERWSPLAAARAFRPETILLCCPHEDEREALSVFLEALGHVVVVVVDLDGAAAALERQVPSIVIVDVSSCGGDVAAFVATCRAGRTRPLLIALGGRGGTAERERARRAGFDVYLLRPVDPVELEPLLARRWIRP